MNSLYNTIFEKSIGFCKFYILFLHFSSFGAPICQFMTIINLLYVQKISLKAFVFLGGVCGKGKKKRYKSACEGIAVVYCVLGTAKGYRPACNSDIHTAAFGRAIRTSALIQHLARYRQRYRNVGDNGRHHSFGASAI